MTYLAVWNNLKLTWFGKTKWISNTHVHLNDFSSHSKQSKNPNFNIVLSPGETEKVKHGCFILSSQ